MEFILLLKWETPLPMENATSLQFYLFASNSNVLGVLRNFSVVAIDDSDKRCPSDDAFLLSRL